MPKAQQVKLNIILSEKLADYLATHPKVLKKYTGSSFVVISYSNKKLNKMNLKLVDDLLDEGKSVVKAMQPQKPNLDWKFITVN